MDNSIIVIDDDDDDCAENSVILISDSSPEIDKTSRTVKKAKSRFDYLNDDLLLTSSSSDDDDDDDKVKISSTVRRKVQSLLDKDMSPKTPCRQVASTSTSSRSRADDIASVKPLSVTAGGKEKKRNGKLGEDAAAKEIEMNRKKQEKLNQKMLLREEKERERESKKLAVAAEKEAKLREQEMRKVIKGLNVQKDKYDSAKEMIVVLSDPFARSTVGEALMNTLTEAGFFVEISKFDDPFSISLKRNVKSKFDKDSKSFMPASEKVVPEPFLIFYWTRQTIIQYLVSEADTNILHMQRKHWSSRFPNHTFIHIVEGLGKAKNDLNTQMNRAFKQSIMSSSEGEPSRKRKQKPVEPVLMVDEDIMLEWSLENKTRVNLTRNSEESLEVILECCYQIGLKPYNVSTEALKVQFGIFTNAKSGLDLKDTWQKFLETLPRLNEERVKAVVSAYPTLNRLLSAYLETPRDDCDNLLSEILTENNRRVGPSASKTIYRHLIETDPNKLY